MYDVLFDEQQLKVESWTMMMLLCDVWCVMWYLAMWYFLLFFKFVVVSGCVMPFFFLKFFRDRANLQTKAMQFWINSGS